MRRRKFITLVGGVAAWPLAARAQQPAERMRRIGILMPYPPGDAEVQARVRAFREELRQKGWASGVNVQFDWDNFGFQTATLNNLLAIYNSFGAQISQLGGTSHVWSFAGLHRHRPWCDPQS